MSTVESPRPGYAPSKEELRNRLRRIEGQVRGVAGMVEDERYCIDVLNQISAVQKALDRVALGLVADHTKSCLLDQPTKTKDSQAEELLGAIDRLVSRR